VNLLFPKITFRQLPVMIGFGILGALIAGTYGMIHDQISYSISPEYFTKLKFRQFYYTDLGIPLRARVGLIGFLATWWVGFFSAWFMARIAVPVWPVRTAWRMVSRGILMILASALISGLIGGCLGEWHKANPDYSGWQEFAILAGVQDLPAFVQVAYIHNAGYLGGLIGLVLALVYLVHKKKAEYF
jgi:hypothetical protein